MTEIRKYFSFFQLRSAPVPNTCNIILRKIFIKGSQQKWTGEEHNILPEHRNSSRQTWNCYSPNYGIAMPDLTPEEKLKASAAMIHSYVIQFPVLLMENVLKSVGAFTASL